MVVNILHEVSNQKKKKFSHLIVLETLPVTIFFVKVQMKWMLLTLKA